jgi:hypothetical protein
LSWVVSGTDGTTPFVLSPSSREEAHREGIDWGCVPSVYVRPENAGRMAR